MPAAKSPWWFALLATGSRAQLTCLVLMGMLCLSGCGGCQQLTPAQKAALEKKEREEKALADKKRREEEAKNRPFDIGRLTPLLSEGLIGTTEGQPLRLAKPGHWTTTVQPMKANLKDFEGRITVAPVDDRGDPLALPNTPYEMTSSRPAVLAKGRWKRVENEFFVPSHVSKLQVKSELVSSAGRVEGGDPSNAPWLVMPSHQYFMLVLAREPARYSYLKVADAIRAPFEDDSGVSAPHYRVVLADGNRPLPLPTNVLTWTSVAYVVWDEVNLDRLDPSQRAALVDWLHWGGRLIVNGPDSLDSLRASFLADYLPVDAGERIQLDAERLEPLSQHWSQREQGKPLKGISVTKPWSGIELKPRAGARALPGGEGLFYERGVGAGSVLVSAVQLSERDLVNWPGFDGFLNSGILRRPPREFRVESEGAWVGLQTLWAGHAERTRDAYFTTPLRWFARDAATQANAKNELKELDPTSAPWYGGYDLPETELVVDRPGGLGDWSEFAPISRTAREALAVAAGVRVPPGSFVVKCLAIYLVVLVPLNWMVFNALGRIEWAWISAPILALGGTVIVVRLAQLDIGFVRSQTEIALLELQGDHPRGHLSRYTAIYSSLSSTYDMEFDGTSAVATPFPARNDRSWEPAIGDPISTVAFEKYDRPRLRGVEVASASTQMIHSEQMVELDGPIRMFTAANNPKLLQLENKSGYNLADVVVVHRKLDDAGNADLKGCWLGELRNGAGTLLSWSTLAVPKDALPFADKRKEAQVASGGDRLKIDPLLKLAFEFPSPDDPLHGARDEYRLVARIDHVLPGAEASPRASQQTGATVVLAHLRLGDAPFPSVDRNSPTDVVSDEQRNAYDAELEEAPVE